MRSFARVLHSAVAAVALTVAGSLWAEPVGFSVNSRGLDIDGEPIDNLWRINLSDGSSERVGPLQNDFLDVEALGFSPSGLLYGADDSTNTLLQISTNSGFASPVPAGSGFQTGNMGLSGSFDFGMSFDCSGRLFVVSATEKSLFEADLATGRLQRVGVAGALGQPISDLAIRGDRVYGVGVGSNSDGTVRAPNLYRLNLSEPSAELVGPLGQAVGQYNNAGLSFAADGTLWAITDRRGIGGQDVNEPSQILRIDPRTGEAEVVAESIIGLESLAIDPPAGCRGSGPHEAHSVPVLSRPALLALCFILFGLACLRLRTRNS